VFQMFPNVPGTYHLIAQRLYGSLKPLGCGNRWYVLGTFQNTRNRLARFFGFPQIGRESVA
jgi:hypothetical protein